MAGGSRKALLSGDHSDCDDRRSPLGGFNDITMREQDLRGTDAWHRHDCLFKIE
jgi:hypothetical protein